VEKTRGASPPSNGEKKSRGTFSQVDEKGHFELAKGDLSEEYQDLPFPVDA
jgi:hypothetical protein